MRTRYSKATLEYINAACVSRPICCCAQDIQAEQEVEMRRFEYLCDNENRIHALRYAHDVTTLRSIRASTQ